LHQNFKTEFFSEIRENIISDNFKEYFINSESGGIGTNIKTLAFHANSTA
jgi:hypothetical protein